MVRILFIETSTSLCSAALAEDGRIVASRESSGTREHAALTAPFVKALLDERGLKVKDCSAVCVGRGPGSYTGLRVGVSTAKGLCFGAGIPLLSVGTLETLCRQAIEEGLLPEGCRHIVPMVDARRMDAWRSIPPSFRPMASRNPKRARKSLKPIVLRRFWTRVPSSLWATVPSSAHPS